MLKEENYSRSYTQRSCPSSFLHPSPSRPSLLRRAPATDTDFRRFRATKAWRFHRVFAHRPSKSQRLKRMFFQHTGSTPFRQGARVSGRGKVTPRAPARAPHYSAPLNPTKTKRWVLRELGKTRELPNLVKILITLWPRREKYLFRPRIISIFYRAKYDPNKWSVSNTT